MRTFDELNELERVTAFERAKALLVNMIIEGVVEVHLDDERLQAQLEAILAKMRREENMNAAILEIFANKALNSELERLSKIAAKMTAYQDNGDFLMEEQ